MQPSVSAGVAARARSRLAVLPRLAIQNGYASRRAAAGCARPAARSEPDQVQPADRRADRPRGPLRSAEGPRADVAGGHVRSVVELGGSARRTVERNRRLVTHIGVRIVAAHRNPARTEFAATAPTFNAVQHRHSVIRTPPRAVDKWRKRTVRAARHSTRITHQSISEKRLGPAAHPWEGVREPGNQGRTPRVAAEA